MPVPELFQEAERQLTICNACRYCEGYCAMFPAMELRRAFTKGDITYLANLCHDCRACFYACMYAPPHEFGVNIPKVMSGVRQVSYQHYSWPAVLARVFTHVPIAGGVAAVALVVGLTFLLAGPGRLFTVHQGPGAFYEVIAYWAMVIPGMVAAGYVIAVWVVGGVQFWRETGGDSTADGVTSRVLLAAAWEALVLRWLRGGGPGCPYPRQHASYTRGILHALVFYGFLATLASTTLAAIYQDLLHRLPPYPVTSAPVVLGTLGGAAIVIGSAGMLMAKIRSDQALADPGITGLDYAFVITLGLAALTGELTLILRTTQAMGLMLTVHLGIVAALFVTAPYSKFVHAVYRVLALVRNQMEQNQQSWHAE